MRMLMVLVHYGCLFEMQKKSVRIFKDVFRKDELSSPFLITTLLFLSLCC